MTDIIVSIPDDVWPRVAAAFHATYPNNTETPDADLVLMALRAYTKDVWLGSEQHGNQNSAGPRYDQAAQDYNTARQQIDTDIAAVNAQVQAEADAAFPGV